VALFVSLVAGLPANAQFWGGWGNWGGWGGQPQQPQQQQRVPRPFNPSGNFFRPPHRPVVRERQEPADYSSAPDPQKKPGPSAANAIVVVGDGMADWLAYGLEDAFAEKPEFAILRRHRTASGLIRYDSRREVEWPEEIKEIIAADKPKFIVMMIGINDRQQIRERPAASSPNAGNVGSRAPVKPRPEPPADLELQAQQNVDQQNAGQEESAESPPRPQEDSGRRGPQSNLGPLEFHSEKWEAAYVKRIDAAIAALKSAGVPVFWVSLPAQRNSRASSDSAYLNELYRHEADKAGITYIDIWDGFVDEAGQYSSQGPDFEGQIRRLRSGDGVYFTKFGARKLAHYVEREILRALTNGATPLALPLEPQATPGSRSSDGAAARPPLAGPVVPLTVLSTGGGDVLLGSARGQPAPGPDPVAARALTHGEALAPRSGRADDFSWPRTSAAGPGPSADAIQPGAGGAAAEPAEIQAPPTKLPKAQARAPGRSADVPNGDAAARGRPPRLNAPPAPADAAARPPMPIRPGAGIPTVGR
jgi:uncharacterized protein